MSQPVFYWILSVLVVWRVTHLLSGEDGPFDLIVKLRRTAGAGFFGSLLDCFYCLSIWIALPFGLWLGYTWWEKLLFWWALSGAACLLEKLTRRQEPPFYKED